MSDETSDCFDLASVECWADKALAQPTRYAPNTDVQLETGHNSVDVKLPSEYWRSQKAKERQEFLAGKIEEKDCFMEQLFPDEFIDRTDVLLKVYISSVLVCAPIATDYPKIMAALQQLVVALNSVNDDFDGSVIETGEREQLCEFIDNVLIEHGIDIESLAESQHCGRHEITDKWRDW